MKHIGLQQITDSVDESHRIDGELVLMDTDDIARLSGYDIIGCRLIVLVADGEIDAAINGHAVSLEKNDFVDILEGTRLRFGHVSPGTEAVCIATTRKQIMDALLGTVTRIQNYILKILTEPVLHLEHREAVILMRQARLMASAFSDMSHRYRSELARVYFKAFILELSNMLTGKYENDMESYTANLKKRDMLIAGFMELLWKHLPADKEVAFYAKELCVTPKHLSRAIKAGTGKSPHEIIAGELLALAMQLLRNDNILVQQVSDYLHFSDQAAFSKFFKKYTGTSPAEYRKADK